LIKVIGKINVKFYSGNLVLFLLQVYKEGYIDLLEYLM